MEWLTRHIVPTESSEDEEDTTELTESQRTLSQRTMIELTEDEDSQMDAEESKGGLRDLNMLKVLLTFHTVLAMRWLLLPITVWWFTGYASVMAILTGQFFGWSQLVLVVNIMIYMYVYMGGATAVEHFTGMHRAAVLVAGCIIYLAAAVFLARAPLTQVILGWWFLAIVVVVLACLSAGLLYCGHRDWLYIGMYFVWSIGESATGVIISLAFCIVTMMTAKDITGDIIDEMQLHIIFLWLNLGLSLLSLAVQCYILVLLCRGLPECGGESRCCCSCCDSTSSMNSLISTSARTPRGNKPPSWQRLICLSTIGLYFLLLLVGTAIFFWFEFQELGELVKKNDEPPECSACYCNKLYDTANVRNTSNIVYGREYDTIHGFYRDLHLDMYDARPARQPLAPAILLLHGGGFVSEKFGEWGSKLDTVIVDECNYYATHGFVAFAIEYRTLNTGSSIPSAGSALAAVYDLKAAVRFVVKNAAAYGVDPDRIATWGASAGAITGATMKVVPGEGESGNPGFPSRVAAGIGISGTINPWLISRASKNLEMSPWLDVHNLKDAVVMPFLAQATYYYLRAGGLPNDHNRLLLLDGGSHDDWEKPIRDGGPPVRDYMRPWTMQFLANTMDLSALTCTP